MKNMYITPSKLTIIGLDKINQNIKVHYIVYKITFKNNNFYYIGQHKTEKPLDNYVGSGTLLKQYKKKYGLANMIKEILFDFDNYSEMDKTEYELVPIHVDENRNDNLCLNLMEGGHSCHQTEESKRHLSEIWNKKSDAEKQRIKNIISEKNKAHWENKTNEEREEWRNFCRDKNIGENNPMYGVELSSCMDQDKYLDLIQKNSVRFRKLAKDLGQKRKGKTLEELYGKEKAMRIRQKIKDTKAAKAKALNKNK